MFEVEKQIASTPAKSFSSRILSMRTLPTITLHPTNPTRCMSPLLNFDYFILFNLRRQVNSGLKVVIPLGIVLDSDPGNHTSRECSHAPPGEHVPPWGQGLSRHSGHRLSVKNSARDSKIG